MSLPRIRLERGLPRYQTAVGNHVERKLEMVERFNTWLEHQQYTPHTRKYYCKMVREACVFFGRKPLRSVGPLEIGDFLQHASTPRWTGDRFRAYLVALRCFLSFFTWEE
jgi:Phage integrase, N-terminal SAM-like domain